MPLIQDKEETAQRHKKATQSNEKQNKNPIDFAV